MEKVQVTWGATLQVWWSYVWRCILFSMIVGVVLGFIGGVVAALAGSPDSGAAVGAVLGYLGSIPVSLWVMKTILGKEFGGFSVALVRSREV